MTIAIGTTVYIVEATGPVIGHGLAWSMEEMDAALSGAVAEIVFDDSGREGLDTLISGLSGTDFDSESIRRILERTITPEDWRVGEALAEAYLVHNCACHFPWPDGRDERKSGSSLPGADLVGFHKDGNAVRFAFGEIKTSTENSYPPGAMYGTTGLKQQLEDLRDKPSLRQDLIYYLGHRAINAPWKDQFRCAFGHYAQDTKGVRIFGVLVRDVVPHCDDIRARVNNLKNNCPATMRIELLAIYLPEGSITTLSEKVRSFRGRVDA